jgi:hypothetical protein
MYLAWFDHTDPKKKPTMQKIAEGMARYQQKFGAEAVVCLCNPTDAAEVQGIEVRAYDHISRHCFWIGCDDPG